MKIIMIYHLYNDMYNPVYPKEQLYQNKKNLNSIYVMIPMYNDCIYSINSHHKILQTY